MWKKLVPTARFTLRQHFTNCSQQPKRTDFTAYSTKRNQNTREDLDVLTKRWTILQHADCWNRNAGSGVSKCASRQCTSWRHFDSTRQQSLWRALENAVPNHVTSASWRGYTRHRKGQSPRTKKSTCLRWRGERKGDFCPVYTSTRAPNATERWCGALAKSKGMEIRLAIMNLSASQSCVLLTDVFLFSTSLVRLQKVMCDFKQITESVGLKIHRDKTIILSSQSANRRKEVETTTLKLRYYLRVRARNTWTKNYISATGKSRDQKSNQSGLDIFLQIHTRADIKIILPTTQTPLIQHGDHADAELRSDTWTLSKEHERMIRSTQRKMLRFIVQTKKKYKKKTQPSRNEEDDEDRKQTTEAQMKKLQKVSVQTQIATKTATFPSWMTPMKILTQAKLKKKIGWNTWSAAQLWQLNGWQQPKSHAGLKHTKKNEMALDNETCIATRWTTGKESSNMEPRPQHQNQDMQICGKTLKRCEDEIMTQARGNWRHERQWNKEQRHMDQSGKKSRKMEGNGKWIRNDCSRSICWQCAKQKKSSARSSSTRTVPERCEAGRTRGGEHHGATHRGPDWLWLIQRQTSPVNWDTKSNTKELMPRRADELKPHRWQSLPHFSLRPLFPLSNESVDSAALLKFTVFPGTLAYPRVFEFNRICHSKGLLIFPRATLYSVLNRVPRVFLARWPRRTDIRFFLCGAMTPALMSAGPLKDEIRRPIEERRNTERRQTPTEQEDQKVHQRQKKNETTRKDTADSGGIHRHQKFFMHNIWKEKNGRPEGEKWQRRDNHIQKRSCECLRSILQQAVCRKSAWRRSTRPSKPGNKNEHWAEKLLRRPEKWNTRVHTSWNTSCHW